MASIDDRVVAMSFENGKFESGANKTIGTLAKLKSALNFGGGAGKGLEQLQASANGVNLGRIAQGVEGIKSKFTALKLVGVAALATIASRATSAGLSLAKSFTIKPLTDGFKEYETGLKSVQTILANTQAAGTNIGDVNKTLDELNHYADKTIYNFGEMTKNIGTFTAAGVDLETSAKSIKGIANLAALSGSNSEQAASAMYQLSQAISSGKVGLQDWNSVVNAGMGGTAFQRALATTAEKMGTLEKGSVSLEGKMKNVKISGESFRDSIGGPGPKWLTGDVLTATLEQFTGDMSDAELRAKGFTTEQIKAIQLQAKTALNAATQVKTLGGVLDTAKEAAGSGWAQTWRIIFGDFNEAKKLFTALSQSINGFIGESADARNKVLGDWKELGGRTAAIQAVKNVFAALGSVIKPIKQAFRDIFPATTGKQLYDMTVRFRDFTKNLKLGGETSENLKRTFRGVFAVLSIGKQIIGGLLTVVGKMFGAFVGGGGGVLKFTGNVGDMLVALDKSLKKGDRLHKFFEALGTVLAAPIRLLSALRNALLGALDGWDEEDASDLEESFGLMGEKLAPLKNLANGVKSAFSGLGDALAPLKAKLQPAIDAIAGIFSNLGSTLGDAIAQADFGQVLDVIKTGLLGGIFLVIRKFFKNGISLDGGVFESITGTFDALTGKLKAMQTNVNADTLKKIAIALGLLTASIVALSLIDGEKLKKALTAMAVAMGQLVIAMGILMKAGGTKGFAKVPLIAASMILLATAVTVLTAAVTVLSRLSFGELIKGLGGVGALLTGLALVAKPLTAAGPGLISAGVGMTGIAVAMRIMAEAVKAFGDLDLSTIAKGITAITASLILVGAAVTGMPPGLPAMGIGLVAIAVALRVLATAVRAFGDLKLVTMGKGLLGIGASLLVIATGMHAMPRGLASQAAGLVLISVALRLMAGALRAMGSLSLAAMAKSLVLLAGSLSILAVGMRAMTGSLAGAAALTVAAAGLALLAPVLVVLGKMSWGSIVKGLVALGGAIGIFTAAALLLAPIGPALLGISAAVLAFGAAVTLIGGGVALFATGLSALAVSGPAGIAIMSAAMLKFAATIPAVATKFVEGLLAMANAIAQKAPQFISAFSKILQAMLQTVIINAPKMAEAFGALVKAALRVITENGPAIIAAGFLMLTKLLSGIANNIGRVTTQVAVIIVRFLSALTARLPQLIAAGANLLVKFLAGVARELPRIVTSVATVIAKFLGAVASNIGKVVSAGANLLVQLVKGIGNSLGKIATAGGDAMVRFVKGIGNAASNVVSEGVKVAGRFIRGVADAAVKLVDSGFDAVIKFIRGVAKAARERGPELVRAGTDLGLAIVEGAAKGLASLPAMLARKLYKPIEDAVGWALKKLKIKSPSRVFMDIGKNVVLGFAAGLNMMPLATDKVRDAATDVIDIMSGAIGDIPDMLDGNIDIDPVITPVLDLTNVEAEAKRLDGMGNVIPISAASSFGQATAISEEKAETDKVTEEAANEAVVPFHFEQKNYSPEALSPIEVYRQTKNGLSQAKDYFDGKKTG